METPGEVAYKAFWAASGRPANRMPAFETLHHKQRAAWEAAADAECRRYGAIY
jgi:hypothetical protein